jgi:prephenate dehydratase
MALNIRRVDYFSLSVKDQPGEAYKLLALLAERGINLLAFTAVPTGELLTQLTIFPEDTRRLASEARQAGLELEGPHAALLVQGDDELGALADVHRNV